MGFVDLVDGVCLLESVGVVVVFLKRGSEWWGGWSFMK